VPQGIHSMKVKDDSVHQMMVDTGLLLESDLEEALEIGRNTGQQIGRVLVMSGFISERQLQAAISVQQEIDSGRMTPEQAVASLQSL
jgi:hypothetical protein